MEANKRAVDSVNTSDMWERLEPFAVGDIERVTSSASLAYCDSGQLIKEVTHTVRDCLSAQWLTTGTRAADSQCHAARRLLCPS